MSSQPPMAAGSVVILADDLIWATRLAELVRGSGRTVTSVRTLPEYETVLAPGRPTIIDLTARAYRGVAAVEMAARADARILCVGQHDDRDLRQQAMQAGAQRVLPYRALFERGPALLARWLDAGGDPGAVDEGDQPGGDA